MAPNSNMFAPKNKMLRKSGSSMTVAGEVWCTFWTALICCSSANFSLSPQIVFKYSVIMIMYELFYVTYAFLFVFIHNKLDVIFIPI